MGYEEQMSNSNPTIKCKKCGAIFQPDVKTRGAWICGSCRRKNPNLKRHYRSVGDLCVLGFVVTVIFLLVGLTKRGLDLAVFLSVADAVLLLVTIVVIYRSATPWADTTVKVLIWVVFGLAFGFNVAVPLLLSGVLNIIALAIYAMIFSYLFWLNAQAARCTV